MHLMQCGWLGALAAFPILLCSAVALPAQTIAQLNDRAAAGDASAQFRLGLAYSMGRGAPLDLEQAVHWYRKAGDRGNADAQYNLGVAYRNGLGVRKDDAASLRWFRKAAEQGNAEAEFMMGVAYETGRVVREDKTQALLWFRSAAERQGYWLAETHLAEMYASGVGTPKDDAEAARWYAKAAQQGDAGAQCKLGDAYLMGAGVAADSAQAARWYREAAVLGEASAQYQLGAMYQSGEGVVRDYAEAYFWLKLAAAGQAEPARREEIAVQRDAAASNLSDAALALTEERLRKWSADHVAEAGAP